MIDKDQLNFDGADFHGLSSKPSDEKTPYSPPNSSLGIPNGTPRVELGFWVWFFSCVQALWFGFLFYLVVNVAMHEKYELSHASFYGILALIGVLFLGHVLLLARKEFGRKVVLAQSYVLLLGIPIGTLIGIIYIRTLYGKRF